jgi:hypothetical protein
MARNALPVPADQYGGASGGVYRYWDELTLNPPAGATYATIELLYQPTSWEYIQFLYLANNGQNAFLADEGKNMLDAWLNTGMAEPYVMASTTWGTEPSGGGGGGGCDAAVPTMLTAVPGADQVALTWEGDPNGPASTGYRLYYDQAGKAQLVDDLPCTGSCTEYTDTGLTNGQQYCYKVTSYTSAECESGFSNILCATTTDPGQADTGVVDPMLTGTLVREGKGKNATETFTIITYPDAFSSGDAVVIQGTVVDKNGTPTANAEVSVEIRTEAGVVVTSLLSAPTDQQGKFEVTWNTQSPNKKGNGGTDPGTYVAEVNGVSASGYSWDAVATAVAIAIQ